MYATYIGMNALTSSATARWWSRTPHVIDDVLVEWITRPFPAESKSLRRVRMAFFKNDKSHYEALLCLMGFGPCADVLVGQMVYKMYFLCLQIINLLVPVCFLFSLFS
jgi:hypothetical protein